MDAFFAAVEQHDNLKYRSKPIGVVNGRGSTIITAFMRLGVLVLKQVCMSRAKDLCPDFIPVSSRPNRYAEVSTNFLARCKT